MCLIEEAQGSIYNLYLKLFMSLFSGDWGHMRCCELETLLLSLVALWYVHFTVSGRELAIEIKRGKRKRKSKEHQYKEVVSVQ